MPDKTQPYAPESCPSCGALPTTGVVAGSLCPRCLLVAGLANRGMTETGSGQRTSGTNRWQPPLPTDLADQFPDLEILELAGRGGMGAVYKVRQTDLNRIAALKVLPPEVAENPAFAVRFERESQALAKLNHPNIVQIYQSGKTDRYYYFLMEFVDGINLRDAIRSKDLEPHEALAIVPQICDALQYAHTEGIVHRDIKPENILLDKDGRVKVTDFGLAKMVDWAHDASLTGTQQVMGTAHYMAPEQVNETRNVDHRADIYSLGVVFYEMLTGRLPLGRFALPSASPAVDSRLDRVVLRTLENEPDRRYQAASEIKSDIHSLENGQPKNAQFATTSFAPAAPIKQTMDSASRKVRAPALCLQIIGYLSITITVMLVFVVLLMVGIRIPLSGSVSQTNMLSTVGSTATLNTGVSVSPPQLPVLIGQGPAVRPTMAISFVAIGLISMIFLHVPVSIMMIIAGRRMARFSSYGFVVLTCILAMLPLNPLFFLFSFVAGIWSLIVLNHSDVQQAFEESKFGPILNH